MALVYAGQRWQFGKPDASVFTSVRNATFGEFGRLDRDLRMPSTTGSIRPNVGHMLSLKRSSLNFKHRGCDEVASVSTMNTNETFSLRHGVHLAGDTSDKSGTKSLVGLSGMRMNNGTIETPDSTKLGSSRARYSQQVHQSSNQFPDIGKGPSSSSDYVESSLLRRTTTELESLLYFSSMK